MSTREQAYYYIDRLSEKQLDAIVEILKGLSFGDVPEVEPDDWDMEMIKRAETENDGATIKFEELVSELGISADEL